MGQATSTMASPESTTTVATAVAPVQPTAQTNGGDAPTSVVETGAAATTTTDDAPAVHSERKALLEDICRRLQPITGLPLDPNTTVVPGGGLPAVASQADLDAALASIADPTAVTVLRIGVSHTRPITNASLLDKHNMIPDGMAAAVYADHTANAYSLAGLSAFTALKALDIVTDDGCPHPIFVSVPRAVWSGLDAVDGDWTKFVIVD